MHKVWAVIGVSLVLVGCATTQTPLSEARPVPQAFIYSTKAPSSDEGSTLVVIRDSGNAGGGCRFGVYVDGQRVADLDPKEMISIQVKSGQRILGVGPAANNKGLCSFHGEEIKREIEASFAVGQKRYFRMSMLDGGILALSPVSQP